MNKKLLTALIIPLMLMPLVSFAYAHWTDKVTKQIKLHAGTVEVEIVQFHIDSCNSYDVSCDDIVWIVGDYPINDTALNPHYDPDIKYELIIEKMYRTGAHHHIPSYMRSLSRPILCSRAGDWSSRCSSTTKEG